MPHSKLHAKPRKRIAIVSREVSGVTGTTTTIIEHSRRLSRAGWEVHVFGERIDAGRLAAAGAESHLIRRWRLGSFFKRRLFAWLFARELRGESFDLVCGHGDTLEQDVLSLHNCVHAAHLAVHGRPLPARSGVGRMHARILGERRFRLLIANSELMRRDVIERFGVPPERVLVIHPGHDPERFKPADRERLGAPLRRELGLREGEFLIGLLSSGDFAKRGVACFLESLARLGPAARGKIRAIVLGKEARLSPYRALARRSGLGERVRFLAPDPAVERYYHALDLYVHPALYEEFGQSVQEAMACGVPVLTSRRVGASELFWGESRSILLPAPEPEALARAVERLVRDEDLRARWGRWGAEACAANTWEANFQRTLAVYESLGPHERA